MNYTDDMQLFIQRDRPFESPDIKKRVWMGVWASGERNPVNYRAQIERAAATGFGGVAVFSYGDLFPNHKPNVRAAQVYQAFTGGTDWP